jgi:hypothetical protein
MSKSKKAPDMGAFLGSVMGQLAATPVAETAAPPTADQVRRGRGRPPKSPDDRARQTAIRLDPDDLKKVKKLAVDDGMTFNRVVYRALEAYCETRGVRLIGADRK